MASEREIRGKRQDAILELIAERKAIRTQAELQELLQEKGIPATQPSISRDLQELGIKRLDRSARLAVQHHHPSRH